MNHQLSIRIVVVVQTGLVLAQYEIWLEAHYIVQKPSELVNLASHHNIWARVFIEVESMRLNIFFEQIALLSQLLNLVSELKYLEKAPSLSQLFLLANSVLKIRKESLHARKSVLSKIFGRGSVLLNAF